MAKKFLYVSLGILALTAACNLDTKSATASNARDPFPIGHMVAGSSNYVLTGDGKVWDLLASADVWTEVDGYSPIPVLASEVALFNRAIIITRSGGVWWIDGSGNRHQCSPPPGGSVSLRETTWGRLKAQYRD